MKKFGRAGSTFGTVVAAAVVLSVATTGGAVAGGLITSKQIKNNTIKSIDVRDGNLTGVDVADGSLGTADLAAGAVTNGKLGAGSVDAGKLAAGAVTSTKLGTIVTRTNQTDIATGNGGFVQVSCNAGEKLIGGGATTAGVGTSAGWNLIRSSAITNGWDAAARNATGGTATLIVEAYCLQ